MLVRIIRAAVIAVVVGLLCLLVGAVLGVTDVAPLEVVGGFLTQFAWAFAVLAFVWLFLGGTLHIGGA